MPFRARARSRCHRSRLQTREPCRQRAKRRLPPEFRFIAANQKEYGAFAGQGGGNGMANAPAGAGDHCAFIYKSPHAESLASLSKPSLANTSADLAMLSKSSPDRAAISAMEQVPSDRFRTQSAGITSVPIAS